MATQPAGDPTLSQNLTPAELDWQNRPARMPQFTGLSDADAAAGSMANPNSTAPGQSMDANWASRQNLLPNYADESKIIQQVTQAAGPARGQELDQQWHDAYNAYTNPSAAAAPAPQTNAQILAAQSPSQSASQPDQPPAPQQTSTRLGRMRWGDGASGGYGGWGNRNGTAGNGGRRYSNFLGGNANANANAAPAQSTDQSQFGPYGGNASLQDNQGSTASNASQFGPYGGNASLDDNQPPTNPSAFQ